MTINSERARFTSAIRSRMVRFSAVSDASTVTVMGVKLDGWSYSLPEDDFVMEEVHFKALWVKVEDAGA